MIEFNPSAIRAYREKAGMTQQELAKRLGCSRQRISQYESSGAVVPTLKTMIKIWRALGVDDPKPFFIVKKRGG